MTRDPRESAAIRVIRGYRVAAKAAAAMAVSWKPTPVRSAMHVRAPLAVRAECVADHLNRERRCHDRAQRRFVDDRNHGL
jgi:hypothetical protein